MKNKFLGVSAVVFLGLCTYKTWNLNYSALMTDLLQNYRFRSKTLIQNKKSFFSYKQLASFVNNLFESTFGGIFIVIGIITLGGFLTNFFTFSRVGGLKKDVTGIHSKLDELQNRSVRIENNQINFKNSLDELKNWADKHEKQTECYKDEIVRGFKNETAQISKEIKDIKKEITELKDLAVTRTNLEEVTTILRQLTSKLDNLEQKMGE